MHEVAKSFKMKAFNISDDPKEILKYQNFFFKGPMLLNINTNRLFWHSGAGIDSDKIFDRYKSLFRIFGNKSIQYDFKINRFMKKKWQTIYGQL